MMRYHTVSGRLRILFLFIIFLFLFLCYPGIIISQVSDSSFIQAQKPDSGFQEADTGNISSADTVKSTLREPAVSERQPIPDSVAYGKLTFTGEELVRGERLFYGLVYFGKESVDCADCHNTRVSDTLNLNPDALEISLKYRD